MQLAAIIVSLVLTVVGVALIARAVAEIYRFVKLGSPVPAGSRTDERYGCARARSYRVASWAQTMNESGSARR